MLTEDPIQNNDNHNSLPAVSWHLDAAPAAEVTSLPSDQAGPPPDISVLTSNLPSSQSINKYQQAKVLLKGSFHPQSTNAWKYYYAF